MRRASVIIPTRDRASQLDACLASLTTQTLPADQFEVIVVDNGSRDDTPRVVDAYMDRLDLRYVPAPIPGLHEGRHAGYRAALTDVLMYADDDIRATSTWVETVLSVFADPGVALVGGNSWPMFESEPPQWLRLLWSRHAYKGRALGYLSVLDFGSGRFAIDPAYVWGCNFSVRRDVLASAGGFHPDSLPREMIRFRGDGETYVANYVRGRGMLTMFDSGASVHHLVPASRMSSDYFAQRAFAQGISDSYTVTRRRGGSTSRLRGACEALVRTGGRRGRAVCRTLTGFSRAAQWKLLAVEWQTIRSWQAGFAFHQSQVRSDPLLLDWVLRKNYL